MSYVAIVSLIISFLVSIVNYEFSFRSFKDDDLPRYRTIKKVREHLIELGHVKVVTIFEPTQSKYNEHGPKRCYLQLVTPLVLRNNEDSDDDDADADNEESTSKLSKFSGFLDKHNL